MYMDVCICEVILESNVNLNCTRNVGAGLAVVQVGTVYALANLLSLGRCQVQSPVRVDKYIGILT